MVSLWMLAYGPVVFGIIIEIACFFPQSHAFALRAIGAGIFSIYA